MADTVTTYGRPMAFDSLMVTSTANTDSASGTASNYSITATTATDYTIGDIVSLTGKLAKGTMVTQKSGTTIYISKPVSSTFSSSNVTIHRPLRSAKGGPSSFRLVQGSGITLANSVDASGAPAVTITSSASGADGMGSGFVFNDGSSTETVIESETVSLTSGGNKGIDPNVISSGTKTAATVHTGTTTEKKTITISGGASPIRIGMTVTGTGIPANSVVEGIPTLSTILINNACTATNASMTLSYTSALDINLDINSLSSGGIASGDMIAFSDEATSGDPTLKESIDDVATLFAGAGLTATNAAIAVDADQSGQITSVGTLTSLTVDTGAAALDVTTMSLDSTDTTNLTMTADAGSHKTLTIAASNSNASYNGLLSLTSDGRLNIDSTHTTDGVKIGTSTSGVPITIGHGTSEVTIGDNLTVSGDLTVSGTNTVISSTTINVDDKNLELGAVDTPTNTTADGGGITLMGATNKTIIWDSTNSNWTSNQDWNIATGKKFKIANADIFTNATTLASGVVTSSLTTVSALNSGSITSGFTSIDVGAGGITTTGTIGTDASTTFVGGQLDIDNITINGNDISSTDTNGNITFTLNGNGLVTIPAGDLSYAGTAITTTGAELNYLGLTAAIGTVSASEAVVVDASKDMSGFRNLTATGAVQGGTLSADAIAVIDTSRGITGTDITGATTLATYKVAGVGIPHYKTAKYVYQIKADSGQDTDVGEILVTYGVTSNNVYLTEYGMISTGDSVGDWTAVYDSGSTSVQLKFTPSTDGEHTYTIMNTLLLN